ncbi:MAG TPA: ATP-binding protein [Thermomicrobiales bacterium]|nr:ATP-binding protein [Thermomicrobiales bacterium]
MSRPALVIVSGLPASGKTTLARRLAHELRLPLLARDDIKERLFDQLGWSDRDWSRRLGGASWELLYWAIEAQLAAGRSCIAESNFHPERDRRRFRELGQRFMFTPIEIHCYATGSVLVERYLARIANGSRHPGHVDHVTIDEQREQLLAAAPEPLALGGATLLVDTTDPSTIDYDSLVNEVRSMLTEAEWRSRG